MIDPRSLETGINAGQGGTPMRRVPPCQPSGRQDLNLRPLDPQRRPATPPTCGNSESAGHRGAVRGRSAHSTQPDAGQCSRSAPEILVNESHRTAGSSQASQQCRGRAVVHAPTAAVEPATATRRAVSQPHRRPSVVDQAATRVSRQAAAIPTRNVTSRDTPRDGARRGGRESESPHPR